MPPLRLKDQPNPSGQVLVVGGLNVSPSIWSSADLYDPASNGWSPAGSLANARVRHTTTLLPNGEVLVVGGCTGAAVGSATSFIGNVETFEMTARGAEARSRYAKKDIKGTCSSLAAFVKRRPSRQAIPSRPRRRTR